MIFQSSLNYIIDTFQMYAASGVAAVTFLRSVFAAVFPLFAAPSMYPPAKTGDVSDLWLISDRSVPQSGHSMGVDFDCFDRRRHDSNSVPVRTPT